MRAPPGPSAEVPRRALRVGLLTLALATLPGIAAAGGHTATATGRDTRAPSAPGLGDRCGPVRVALEPTRAAPGAAGYLELAMAPSPFGVAVGIDGRYLYDVTIQVERLRRRPGEVYVAWAATPELDRVRKLGAIDGGGAARGRVDYNKFLVFVTAEASTELERWQGRVLLTGLSPSGLMHTMRGHGIFEAHGVGC